MKVLIWIVGLMVSGFGPMPACFAKIAFSGYAGDFWQIWVMEDDGSHPRQITTDAQDKRLPVWVDRHRLLYETNQGQVFLLDLKTGQSQRLFQGVGYVNGCDVDGARVVCAKFRTDTRDLSELYLTDLAGGASTMITHRTGMYRSPQWLAGQQQIITSFKAGAQAEAIHRLHVDTGNEEVVIENQDEQLHPVVSPDGQELLLVSNESGNYELWSMRLGTGARRRLTDFDGLDTQPRWMGSGQIVFVSTRSGELALWKVSHEGQGAIQLTTFPSKDPDWIAD